MLSGFLNHPFHCWACSQPLNHPFHCWASSQLPGWVPNRENVSRLCLPEGSRTGRKMPVYASQKGPEQGERCPFMPPRRVQKRRNMPVYASQKGPEGGDYARLCLPEGFIMEENVPVMPPRRVQKEGGYPVYPPGTHRGYPHHSSLGVIYASQTGPGASWCTLRTAVPDVYTSGLTDLHF